MRGTVRSNDINFKANTIRVDESVDRSYQVGTCKNATAYRTTLLADREGKAAFRVLNIATRALHQPDAGSHLRSVGPDPPLNPTLAKELAQKSETSARLRLAYECRTAALVREWRLPVGRPTFRCESKTGNQ